MKLKKLISGLASVLLVLSFAVALGVFSPDASAYENPLDPSKDCSLTVKLPAQHEDLKDVSFSVSLYRFAEVNADFSFTALAPFAGAEGVPADLSEVRTYDAERLLALATALAKVTEDPAAQSPLIGIEMKKPAGQVSVKAEALKSGLYLVVPEEFEADGERYLSVPFIVALPNGDEEANDWDYDLEAVLKPEVEDLYGAIKLVKHVPAVRRYEKTPEGQTETVEYGVCNSVFRVTGTKDGKTVYSDVITLSLEEGGVKTHVIGGIPVGTQVTVEEAYAGGPYELTGQWIVSSDDTATVKREETVEFHFQNEYDGSRKYSTGAVNHFEISDNSDDYNWIPTYRTPEEETVQKADGNKGGK